MSRDFVTAAWASAASVAAIMLAMVLVGLVLFALGSTALVYVLGMWGGHIG